MASFNVTSSQTLATFLAANPTLTNGDTIIFSGAWTITQNADVALTDLIIDSTGQAGKWVDGTATTYSRTRWSFKAGTSACLTTTAGKTTAGPLSGTGGSVNGAFGVVNYGTITTSTGTGGSVSGAHGVVNNGTITTSTGTGGSVSAAYGVYNNGTITTSTGTGGSVSAAYGVFNDGTITTSTGTGGSVSGAHGVYNNGTITTSTGTGGSVSGAHGVVNYGTITTSTGTGGSVSGAHGVVNYGTITTSTGTGGSVSGAYGVVNYGTITTSTGTGGSVSGAHGVYNNGFCGRGTLTSTVSGAYAVRNTGMLEMDPSICSSTSGPAVFCTVASVVRLPDGASTALIGGVYTVQYWPLASDIVVGKPASGTPALGSVGTGPTRGFLRKMMDG